jgi:hypothetical protein
MDKDKLRYLLGHKPDDPTTSRDVHRLANEISKLPRYDVGCAR